MAHPFQLYDNTVSPPSNAKSRSPLCESYLFTTDCIPHWAWRQTPSVTSPFMTKCKHYSTIGFSYMVRLTNRWVISYFTYNHWLINCKGKMSNFGHKGIKHIFLGVFYSNASKSLHQFMEFQDYVPYWALLLAAAFISHFPWCPFSSVFFSPLIPVGTGHLRCLCRTWLYPLQHQAWCQQAQGQLQ